MISWLHIRIKEKKSNLKKGQNNNNNYSTNNKKEGKEIAMLKMHAIIHINVYVSLNTFKKLFPCVGNDEIRARVRFLSFFFY